MKLKTIRVRRSRPSVPALALTLAITMFCVYLASLSAKPAETKSTAAAIASGAEVRMEGMETIFECDGRYATELEAQVMAAYCAQSGGAGLILPDGDGFAVVRSAGANAGENSITRSAAGLTLSMEGPEDELTAVSEASAFLYSLARETGSLAGTLQGGETDAASVSALMELYLTRCRKLQTAMNSITAENPVSALLEKKLDRARIRLRSAAGEPDPGRLRLLHAAACADWIDMLNELTGNAC